MSNNCEHTHDECEDDDTVKVNRRHLNSLLARLHGPCDCFNCRMYNIRGLMFHTFTALLAGLALSAIIGIISNGDASTEISVLNVFYLGSLFLAYEAFNSLLTLFIMMFKRNKADRQHFSENDEDDEA